jgi:putative membrane protein
MEDPRTFLAAERTFLAWIRTGLAMMGFGFVVARFGLFMREIVQLKANHAEPPTGLSLWFGTALILGGVIVLTFSGSQYYRDVNLLRRGETLPPRVSWLALSLGGAMATIGIAMAVYLLSLTRA